MPKNDELMAGCLPEVIRARELAWEVPGAPRTFMWMPGGVHTIQANAGPKPIEITVRVDAETAAVAQEQLERILARGMKPFFDFEHREREAAAWPEKFIWQESPAPGVYVTATWSQAGAESVAGKVFRGFSPAFLVDKHVTTPESPARVKGMPLVMGGLTNVPAFERNAPLWARRGDLTGGAAGAERQQQNDEERMNKEQLAALKAKLQELETEITAIKARKSEGESAEAIKARAAEGAAKESEARALRAEVRAGELELEIQARNGKQAEEAIQAAIARGAIPAQDQAIQARYRSLIEQDPANVVLLASLPANPALSQGAITGGSRAAIGQEEPARVIRAYMAETDPVRRGGIYASGLRTLMSKEESCDHVIRAANTLGTVAGTLVVQRTLDLLKIAFPVLSRISTNFSGENAAYGEAITTRLVSVPAVGTYHVDNGYVSQAGVTTDVPVTINAHQFVQVEFNANEIGGTRRLLFGEQEDAMHYAIGKDLVDAIYALFLAANFTEGATIEALVDFARKTVIQMGIDMNTTSAGRNANSGTRTLLLSPAYYGKLAEDIVVVSPLYNRDAGSAVGDGTLPMVHGFLPVEAPNLPATANLVGFGMRADAVALAVRPANDYAAAQPGLPATGVNEQVTNPDTGMSVSLTRFVDHYLGKSYMRLAWMRGVAKGNPLAGQLLKSA